MPDWLSLATQKVRGVRRSRRTVTPRRPQPRQVGHGLAPRVRCAREQLVGLGQHQRVRPPLPPGLVPHRQPGRVDPGVHVPASVCRQRPLEDPPRPGAEKRPQRVTEVAPAPGPCDRPVVLVTRRPRDDRAEPLRAVPRDRIEPGRPPRVRRQRAAERSAGIRHSSTLSPYPRSAATISSRSSSSAASSSRTSGELSISSCGWRSSVRAVVVQSRSWVVHPAPGSGGQQPCHRRTPGGTQRLAQPRQPSRPTRTGPVS